MSRHMEQMIIKQSLISEVSIISTTRCPVVLADDLSGLFVSIDRFPGEGGSQARGGCGLGFLGKVSGVCDVARDAV